jgi:hypothetical protein
VVLGLLTAYAVGMYALWVWRLTVDLSRGEVPLMALGLLFCTSLGSCTLGGQLRSVHAALVLFGTIYVCMLVATRGYPARMFADRFGPYAGARPETSRNQLVFVGLLVPVVVAISLFGHLL